MRVLFFFLHDAANKKKTLTLPSPASGRGFKGRNGSAYARWVRQPSW